MRIFRTAWYFTKSAIFATLPLAIHIILTKIWLIIFEKSPPPFQIRINGKYSNLWFIRTRKKRFKQIAEFFKIYFKTRIFTWKFCFTNPWSDTYPNNLIGSANYFRSRKVTQIPAQEMVGIYSMQTIRMAATPEQFGDEWSIANLVQKRIRTWRIPAVWRSR